MTDMVVLAFDSENGADMVRTKLLELNAQFLLRLDQVVEVVRKADGQVKVKEEPKLTGAAALGGAFWGLLIGLIFFIPVVGLAVGAVSGAIVGHFSKYGMSKEFMTKIDEAIKPGQSGLFILAEDVKIRQGSPDAHPVSPKGSQDLTNAGARSETQGSVRRLSKSTRLAKVVTALEKSPETSRL